MKKHLKLFAMMAVVGMICAFAACSKDDSDDNGGTTKIPNDGEDTTAIVKTVVNITFDGVVNVDVSKYSAAYLDTNYRFMFGTDSTVQEFVLVPKGTYHIPMLYISTSNTRKDVYNGDLDAEYRLSLTYKDQQYIYNRGTLTIDSTNSNNTLISGKFDMYMTTENDMTAKPLVGTFINVPLTKK